MTRAIMIDLETLGKRPGCIISSIGAVVFDPHSDWIRDTLHTHIDWADSELRGFKADIDTVKWWLKQDDAAASALVAGQDDASLVASALDGLCNFIASAHYDYPDIWCNGASFDFPILAAYYDHFHWPLPWQYWQERDLRTLKGLNKGARIERAGVHHNALDDAIHQAKLVQHILQFNADMDA